MGLVRTFPGGIGLTEQEIRAAAYAIFSTETPLEDVFTSLNSAGFESEDICVFLSPTHPIADGVRNLNSGDSRSGAEVGVENTVSWLSTFGGVVIPGVGCFVGSREYLRALAQTDCRPETAANGAARRGTIGQIPMLRRANRPLRISPAGPVRRRARRRSTRPVRRLRAL